jgi:hypothetical protein
MLVRVWLGALVLVLGTAGVVSAQPVAPGAPAAPVAPTVTVDPDEASAVTDWTFNLSAPYCGGYQIGSGIYLSPEAPLALPESIPDGSVLFAGNPASFDLEEGVLRVSLGPDFAQSMICMQGDRPLSIELTPSAGFAVPDVAGVYAIDVWTGARPSPTAATFTVPAPN